MTYTQGMYFTLGPDLLNLDALGNIYLGVLAQQTSNDANGNPVTTTLWGTVCKISGDVLNSSYSPTQLNPPSPPFYNGSLEEDFFLLNPDGGNANAYCAAAVGAFTTAPYVFNGYCQLLYSQGSFTLFDWYSDDLSIPPTVTGNNAISDEDFYPTMCNAQGQAIDTIDDLLWDGTGVQTPPSHPVALNDQDDVLCAADVCTNGATQNTNTTLAGKVPKDYATQVQNLTGVAVSNRNTAATGQQPLLNVVASGNIDRSGKGTNWQPTQFLFQELADSTWTVSEIPNSADLQIKAVNSSGVIVAIGNPPGSTSPTAVQHALLLLPVQITNKADPTIRNGANGKDTTIQFLTSSTDTNINAVAWIAANDPNNSNAPRMPELVASAGSISGITYCWKLQVIFHDRNGNPHRDFDTGDPYNTNSSPAAVPQDTVTIPASAGSQDSNVQNGWVQINNGGPWNIYQDPDWQAAVAQGFFGGDAVLSLKILDGSGNTIMPEQDYKFRIAGENPVPQLCQNYIASIYGGPNPPTRNPSNPNAWQGFWFADAIAQEETANEGQSGSVPGTPIGNNHLYHQFLFDGGRNNPVPGKEGTPDWHDDKTNTHRTTGSGGYGLFQLTYQSGETNYIMPRDWIWNWQSNVNAIQAELQEKLNSSTSPYNATSLYNGLTATYPAAGSIRTYGNFSGLESIVITYYNGMYGNQITSIPVHGYAKSPRTCWKPNSSGNGWFPLLQNINSYVEEVNGYVGNAPK
jgi:hypothetical protein